MGKGKHHHGGHHGGGFGYPPYGYGFGYPVQYAPSEVFVVEDSDAKLRAMTHIMALPKAKRAAAYRQLFGKEPAAGSLDGIGQTQSADARSLGGIFETATLELPRPGAPEPLMPGMGGCGCDPRVMGGIPEVIAGLPMPVKVIGVVVGAHLLYKAFKGGRSRMRDRRHRKSISRALTGLRKR